MVKTTDLQVLNMLRQDSRINASAIASQLKIPSSTVYDKIRRLEMGIISDYVSFIDYRKLGYHMNAKFVVKAKDKKQIKQFLLKNMHVNNIYSTNQGHDFIVDCIFRNMSEQSDFKEEMKEMAEHIREYQMIEPLKEECLQLF